MSNCLKTLLLNQQAKKAHTCTYPVLLLNKPPASSLTLGSCIINTTVFFSLLSCLSLSFYIFRILGSYLFLFIRQIIIIKVLSIKGSSRWRNFWIVVWAVAILLFWPMLLNKRWESRNSSAVVWHPQKQNSSPKRAL